MAAAERVAREIMDCCTQRDLLLCRRSLPLEPMRSTRKTDLIEDLVALCECPSRRHSICSHLLASWQVKELRVFIKRLKALGCMVEIGPATRQQHLVAAIINTQEYAPSGLASSRGVCPSPRPAESKGRSAHHFAPPSPREEPASSTPAGTTALVAFDSAADPVKMGRKLARGWAKRWLKFCKKKEKNKWQRIQVAIQSAWEEHGATMTVGDMRALVGHTLGLSLDDTEYRVRFDKALSRITSPPPQRRRKRCRFTIASNGARHQKKKTSHHEPLQGKGPMFWHASMS